MAQIERGDALGMAQGNGARNTTAARSNTAPHLVYHDLREWLAEAQRLGEVRQVKGLGWQNEIGTVSGMAVRRDDAPSGGITLPASSLHRKQSIV